MTILDKGNLLMAGILLELFVTGCTHHSTKGISLENRQAEASGGVDLRIVKVSN